LNRRILLHISHIYDPNIFIVVAVSFP